jgi:Tfp pilus assembly protein PilO
MEQIKKLLGETVVKIKIIVGLVLAGLLVGVAAWRKHVQDEMTKIDQAVAEEKVKEDAAAKLAAETAKLEAERKEKET